MDIEVKITVVLKDNHWGFSDLLEGRELNEESKAEIKDLIMEDITEVINGHWDINENIEKLVNQQNKKETYLSL